LPDAGIRTVVSDVMVTALTGMNFGGLTASDPAAAAPRSVAPAVTRRRATGLYEMVMLKQEADKQRSREARETTKR
jgi:hypothetical protein